MKKPEQVVDGSGPGSGPTATRNKTGVEGRWREKKVTRVKRRKRKAHEGLVQVPRTTASKGVLSDSINEWNRTEENRREGVCLI